MSARRRLRSAWSVALAYSPVHVGEGRLYVGPFVVMTTGELQRTAQEFFAHGKQEGRA